MYPIRLKWFIGGFVLLLSGLLVGHLSFFDNLNLGVIVFGMAVLVSSMVAIQMMRGNGSVSISLPVLMAAGVVLGPTAGLWIGAFATFTFREITGKVRWQSVLFNRAQLGLIGWGAARVFIAFGGHARDLSIANMSGPLVAASTAAFLGNVLVMTVFVALREDRPLQEIIRVYFKWALPGFFVMLPVGYLMAAVYRISGPWPELIFLLPLIAVRTWMVLVKRVREMYNNTIRVLLVGVDAKDPYTFGHSMRVGHYGAVFARHLKLPEDVVEQIRHAGMLHDIGKMAIPDNVLNKRGRLSIPETFTIQRHPVLGSSMLAQLNLAGCARDWVLHHHERWDGTGYPDGLFEVEIPLETRIVSVVDAYDAMTSDRPYRKAMTHEAAMTEIAEERGTQFDPVIVDQFLLFCSAVNLAQDEGSGHGWDRTPNIPIEDLEAEYQREMNESLSQQNMLT